MAKNKYEISNIMALAMIIVAIFFDLIEIILVLIGGIGLILNRGIVIFKWCIFWLWFKILGVSFIKKPSRFLTVTASFIAGLIPGVGALPEFTLGVIGTILTTRVKDKEEVEIEEKESKNNIVRNKNQQRGTGNDVVRSKRSTKERAERIRQSSDLRPQKSINSPKYGKENTRKVPKTGPAKALGQGVSKKLSK